MNGRRIVTLFALLVLVLPYVPGVSGRTTTVQAAPITQGSAAVPVLASALGVDLAGDVSVAKGPDQAQHSGHNETCVLSGVAGQQSLLGDPDGERGRGRLRNYMDRPRR